MLNVSKNAIGSRIRLVRESKGLSICNLAKLADLSAQHLSLIEAGARGLSLASFARLVYVLEVTSDYLLFGHVDTSSASDKIARILTDNIASAENISMRTALEIQFKIMNEILNSIDSETDA